MARQGYTSLEEAATALNVTKGTLHYYIRTLKMETHKFPLDKRAYLTDADFQQIKMFKDQAEDRPAAT
ncbi:MAG TPA: MerR family transcriptional regulator [Ktedonobacteraceae bacterium]|nr:MerR family transcriptional regulator [Ktedonobacteraceae bacterium]